MSEHKSAVNTSATSTPIKSGAQKRSTSEAHPGEDDWSLRAGFASSSLASPLQRQQDLVASANNMALDGDGDDDAHLLQQPSDAAAAGLGLSSPEMAAARAAAENDPNLPHSEKRAVPPSPDSVRDRTRDIDAAAMNVFREDNRKLKEMLKVAYAQAAARLKEIDVLTHQVAHLKGFPDWKEAGTEALVDKLKTGFLDTASADRRTRADQLVAAEAAMEKQEAEWKAQLLILCRRRAEVLVRRKQAQRDEEMTKRDHEAIKNKKKAKEEAATAKLKADHQKDLDQAEEKLRRKSAAIANTQVDYATLYALPSRSAQTASTASGFSSSYSVAAAAAAAFPLLTTASASRHRPRHKKQGREDEAEEDNTNAPSPPGSEDEHAHDSISTDR